MEELRIGQIVSVKGTKVISKLDELLPPYLVSKGKISQSPKINTYVKTRVGISDIICHVNGEVCDIVEFDKSDGHNKSNSLYLNLDVIGVIENGKFLQGIRYLPIVMADVYTLNEEDGKIIFSLDRNSIILGRNIYDPSRFVGLYVNDIIPSHIGIFGNTGSGKSNTLAKLYYEYYNNFLKKTPESVANIVLFDLNNEYGKDAIVAMNDKKIYKLNTHKKVEDIKDENKIPINFSSLTEDDFVVLLNATQKTQAPIIKRVFDKMKDDFNVNDYLDELYLIISTNQIPIYNSIKYRLNEYVKGLENFFVYNKDKTILKTIDRSYVKRDYFDLNVHIEEPKTFLERRSLSKMDRLDKTLQRIDKFNLDRDWNQFHSPENLSKSISIEAAELLECFQWDENNYDLEAVKEELADVMNYCLQTALVLKLDPIEIINKKIDKNEKKYPVEKAKGVSTKYNKL